MGTTNRAEEIAKKYYGLLFYDVNNTLFSSSILASIQDRQSVLEDNKSVFEMLLMHGNIRTRMPVHERIKSLTNQIDYLKTKI